MSAAVEASLLFIDTDEEYLPAGYPWHINNIDPADDTGLLYIGGVEARRYVGAKDIACVIVLVTPKEYSAPNLLKLPDHVQEHHYPIEDEDGESIQRAIAAMLPHVEEHTARGQRVLVHCWAGISRSASLVIAYLMKQHAVTADEALTRLRKKRPIVDPNDGFMAQLRALTF
jgi:hypothetical protein